MIDNKCAGCGNELTAEEVHYYGHSCNACEGSAFHEESGRDQLWRQFGLDRASWLTMPRVMMHAMTDDWQARMAALLQEWDRTWDTDDMPTPYVQGRIGNKFVAWADWVLNYRHPDKAMIDSLRVKR